MNVELLEKVKRHILAKPKRLYMPFVVVRKERHPRLEINYGKSRGYAECGTAACIAGWTCLLSGIKPEDVSVFEASKLLGLNSGQASRLFYGPRGGEADKKFSDIWNGSGTAKEARLAAARIDHFIKTQGAE